MGPSTDATPKTAEKMPVILPLCSGGKVTPAMLSAMGKKRAAAETLNGPEEDQLVDVLGRPREDRAPMKINRPSKKNRRLPYRSESLPKIGIATVWVKMYALKTHA